MVFDDDVKLTGLYQRYQSEIEEMKHQIVNYICSETFGGVASLQMAPDNTTQEPNALDEVSFNQTLIMWYRCHHRLTQRWR